MKTLTLIIFMLMLSSCGQKKGAIKSNFKLIVGKQALSTPMNGGVFLETHELNLNEKKIYKLDSENSATFPTGTYNLLIVAFTGPLEKAGNTYCGAANNQALLSATSAVSITVKQSNCSDSKYLELISKLSGSSQWDSAKFDQGKWGP